MVHTSPSKLQVKERHFVNRKGFHSINVQAVVDTDLIFRHFEAKWPGSTHDSFVFTDSQIRQRFEDRELDGVLVGDSGYARKPYMLVPYGRPSTEAEEEYNRAHAKTRVCVERAFGLYGSWKYSSIIQIFVTSMVESTFRIYFRSMITRKYGNNIGTLYPPC